jgi:hypothetical protein
MPSSTPTRPGTKPEIDEETERLIRERLATYENDRKDTKPWDEVKARILQTPTSR